jgi:hypothetical protein
MLNFENIPVRLLHLSIGKEFRGEDEVTAADLKVEVEMHNNSLDTGSVWIFVCKAVKDLPSGRSSIAFYK